MSKLDDKTLEAIAKVLKAKGKIDKIDMESKAFRKELAREAKAFGKEFKKEGKEWTKAFGKELGAWGDAFKDLFF